MSDDIEDYGEQQAGFEEGAFYYILNEFQHFVKEHGVRTILAKLNKETEEKLYWHYYTQIRKEE